MSDHFYTISETERDAATAGRYVLEGKVGYVYPNQESAPVPLYRAYNSKSGDHFYTSDLAEYTQAISGLGYSGEGTAGYLYKSAVPGTVELFRLFLPSKGKHFYTTNPAEKTSAINQGHKLETSPGFVSQSAGNGYYPLYRLFKPGNSDHFYTMSETERDNATSKAGYVSEGIACYLKLNSGLLTTPFYRCVHLKTNNHFYTTSQAERDDAIANKGYKSEGISCYVRTASLSQNGMVPLFRCYSGSQNDHFYTSSESEKNNAVQALGYKDEGIACYISQKQVTGTVEFFRLAQIFDKQVFLNLIAVSGDIWSQAQWNNLIAGFNGAALLYRQVGIRLNLAGTFDIKDAQAGGYTTIDSNGEATDLTHDFTVNNGAIDVLCVPLYVGSVTGLSPQNGPCNKNDSKRMNGAVVESSDILNVCIAHEVGHYLGLAHANDGTNIMNPGISTSTVLLTSNQGSKMKDHCFIQGI